MTEDGRYLLVFISKGAENKNRLYVADLGQPANPNIGAPVKPVVDADDAEFAAFGNVGPVLYLRTDRGAPNRKVIAVDLRHPEPAAWTTIVPEGKDAIESVSLIGGRLVTQYLADVQSRLSLFTLDGRVEGDIPLPGTGTVVDTGGRQDTPEVFFGFSSPLFPTTVFSYDPASKARVPFFLTARKGLALDGSHPTMLYGYGGFSISTLPTYRADVPAWLEMGGIWVTANMRGGAEYGESWHQGGQLDKKQHVFDDFIAVAEDLVNAQYTSPRKLGILGRSNGGLLVGAVEEQRPDLFAVALPGVGVMDMLRYDRFTGGRAWATEYGSSSDPAQFPFLLKYSPVQNVKPGACYPATLVTTADHDDRVVPSHSFKFTATLQAAQMGL